MKPIVIFWLMIINDNTMVLLIMILVMIGINDIINGSINK